MKQKLVFTCSALFIAVILFAFRNTSPSAPRPRVVLEYKKKNLVSCSPDWEILKDVMEEMDIPVIPGAGNYKWTINTKSDSAQFYFNQGINMYYSFHIIESMASFKKAAKFDPGCAMLYWGQALAYGPNINDLGYAASPEALAATNKAKELAGTANSLEVELINAMASRYTADSADVNRASLNNDYTGMMKKVYEKFPGHPDAQALYADAMMLQHPWDLWDVNGTPKPWTPLIRTVLEKLLLKTPDHPGANHYYIHVMEPSPFFAKALPSADRLGKLTPGLSHTVHMPSHIYLRSGHYAKGVSVNEDAVNSFNKTVSLYGPVSGNAFLYVIHNLHMKTNNAMLAGRSGQSSKSARETANSIPADYLAIPGALGSYIQYIHMTPTLVNVRFGNWGELLTASQPAKEQVFGNIIHHFGRGMALVNHSRLAEARHELEEIRQLMTDSSLYLPFTPFSPAIEAAQVAESLLSGTIVLKEKKYNEAILYFRLAVDIESKIVYNEPRDWMLNPRHYLGNAYIKAGRLIEARAELQTDLRNNNENGWALFGLWQVLTAEKKTAEAAKMLARFRKAFDKSDIKLYGPVF
jgi:tetratricopeptide (TPR) repeat protein